MSVIRISIIRILQLIEHLKSNSSICRHEELLDHTPLLAFYNTFSMVFSYQKISVIRTPLGPNVFG